MDLRSGGDSFAAVGPCSGGVVLEAPREGAGSGGDSGHTIDPVSGESRPASLAPVRGARGPVGQPREPIQICAIYLYVGLRGGDSSIGMTSIGSSSSSSLAITTSTTSSTSTTPSSPSLRLGDDNTDRLSVIGYGPMPIPWMAQGGFRQPLGRVAESEGSISQ
jgi:hypothetical protein